MQQKAMALPALRISAATTELVKGVLAGKGTVLHREMVSVMVRGEP